MNKRTKNLTICALFSAMIAIGAFIKIPVPFVPFTLQFLFTNLAGLILGGFLGAASVGVYIVMGLIGIPVFTAGSGIGYIFQPTFGYIIGFLIGTFLSGFMAQHNKNAGFKTYLLAGFINLFFVYAAGILHYFYITSYYLKSPLGIKTLFIYCIILPIPGDILICFLSAFLANRIKPILKREGLI